MWKKKKKNLGEKKNLYFSSNMILCYDRNLKEQKKKKLRIFYVFSEKVNTFWLMIKLA